MSTELGRRIVELNKEEVKAEVKRRSTPSSARMPRQRGIEDERTPFIPRDLTGWPLSDARRR